MSIKTIPPAVTTAVSTAATAVAPAWCTEAEEAVLVGRARAWRVSQRALEVDMVTLAVDWALAHPGQPEPVSRYHRWLSRSVRMGGAGTPEVDEFSMEELGAELGISGAAAMDLVAQALELTMRLPATWERVRDGRLRAGQARRVAAKTVDLNDQAAAAVDAAVAALPKDTTLGWRRLERLIGDAVAAHDAALAARRRREAARQRRVDVDTRAKAHEGLATVFGVVDLPVALELDRALQAGAAARRAAGDDASMDVLRAAALGDLARTAQGGTPGILPDLPSAPSPGTQSPHAGPDAVGSDLAAGGDLSAGETPATGPGWDGRGAPRSQVLLQVCINAADIHGLGNPAGAAWCQGPGLGGALVTVETIRAWLTGTPADPADPAGGPLLPQVLVRPVLDLDDDHEGSGYAFTELQREHITARSPQCCFPHCDRPARACDIDHIRPWAPGGTGGATCTCQGAPLCRRHHRLKTHSDHARDRGHNIWSYVHLGAGLYHWVGPHGRQLLTGDGATTTLPLLGDPDPPGALIDASDPHEDPDSDEYWDHLTCGHAPWAPPPKVPQRE